MRVTLNSLSGMQDPVAPKPQALKAPASPGKLKLSKPPAMKKPKNFNPQPGGTSMFGSRAMKSPEDYETGQAVQGLGKSVSPYYAQQFAKNGRQLRYDTATNTYR